MVSKTDALPLRNGLGGEAKTQQRVSTFTEELKGGGRELDRMWPDGRSVFSKTMRQERRW